jgi:hypothetical protein
MVKTAKKQKIDEIKAQVKREVTKENALKLKDTCFVYVLKKCCKK